MPSAVHISRAVAALSAAAVLGAASAITAACTTADAATPGTGLPQLFMNAATDINKPWGLITQRSNTVELAPDLVAPPANASGGGACIAAYTADGGGYELFFATGTTAGTQVTRAWTPDMVAWPKPPVRVWFANASLPTGVYSIKSMARASPTGPYLLSAFADHPVEGIRIFASTDGRSADSFKPTITPNPGYLPNFSDHDDVNLIYNRVTSQFVDMQIMFEAQRQEFCDNAGCDRRRVVTVRTTPDEGVTWSNDWGCTGPGLHNQSCGGAFNASGAITPDDVDPPELQFYRLRPSYLGSTGRLVAHALLYAPSPYVAPDWGMQPPSCYTCMPGQPPCCHGPHIMDEWWIGPTSGDPTDLHKWARPFRGGSGNAYYTRAAPVDISLMAAPLTIGDEAAGTARHVWVSDGQVWALPQHRVAGVYAPANGVFTTAPFAWPGDGAAFLNAEALWHPSAAWAAGTGHCDQGCAAYVMAELRFAANDTVVPGRNSSACVFMNVSSTHLPLAWGTSGSGGANAGVHRGGAAHSDRGVARAGAAQAVTGGDDGDGADHGAAPALPPGVSVTLTVHFRDATVYAVYASS